MEHSTNKPSSESNKRLMAILATVAFVLLIPLVAMQFTKKVDWDLADFVIMGILLLATGLSCELVMRKVNKIEHRVLLCAAILFVALLIWADLAVGIFNIPGFSGS